MNFSVGGRRRRGESGNLVEKRVKKEKEAEETS
jgi:hypothetical protein